MTARKEINNYRTTATVVGIVYLVGFVVGIGGIIMIQSILGAPNRLSTLSANSMTLAIGAVLWLIAVVGDAAHGVLMFPILKQHSERMAVIWYSIFGITINSKIDMLQIIIRGEYENYNNIFCVFNFCK